MELKNGVDAVQYVVNGVNGVKNSGVNGVNEVKAF